MFMNFMDYTNDACMYMFTHDQRTRIQTALTSGTFRSQLTVSANTLCAVPASAPTASFTVPSLVCDTFAVDINNYTTSNPVSSFLWSVNPSSGVSFSSSSTAIAPTVSFTSVGVYSITLVATNTLGTSSITQTISVLPELLCSPATDVRNNSILEANITLHPNPSSGIINVFTTLAISQNLDITISNTLGESVSVKKHIDVSNTMVSIDLNSYSNGVYFVTFTNGKEKIVKRIILNK
jgi:PKD repeat protein